MKKVFGIKMKQDEFLAEMKKLEQQSRDLYEVVVREHSGTPWSRRAQYELRMGFGMNLVEGFRDPRYESKRAQIKIPKF